MNLYKVHVFSILYGHVNVPMAFKELKNNTGYFMFIGDNKFANMTN